VDQDKNPRWLNGLYVALVVVVVGVIALLIWVSSLPGDYF
jgi:hypothetical protein